MTIMQLAGFPAEVVDSVVSVLCRMAFDFGLWSDGVAPLLFVCEEAHRYAPADKKVGFGPTRRALSRIAKEGRKYGVFLGLVTQRPAEIDPTIISQCSTFFVMRLANDRDQDADPLGGVGRRRQSFVVHSLARHPRSVHLRLRRRAADAHALPGTAAGAAAEQRSRRQHALRRRQLHQQGSADLGDRTLAQRQHEPPRERGRRRAGLRLAVRCAGVAAGGTYGACRSRSTAAFGARRGLALEPPEKAARCLDRRRAGEPAGLSAAALPSRAARRKSRCRRAHAWRRAGSR